MISIRRFLEPDLARTPVTPLILAHRGGPSAHRPENTVSAAVTAVERGADGVEIDVRASGDGSVVCSHDPDLRRVAGSALTVATTPVSVLRGVALPGGHRLALLEEMIAELERRGRCRVVIEAKASLDPAADRRLVERLPYVLSPVDQALDLTVSSFDATLLARLRRSMASLHVRTALLGQRAEHAFELLQRTAAAGHDEMHAHVASLMRAPEVVRAARARGVDVTCWTVNSGRTLRRLAGLGIDAVITDDAAAARAALGLPQSRTLARPVPA